MQLVIPSFRVASFALLLASLSAPCLADEKPRLRVLTYNIHHGEGTDKKFDLERQAKIILSVKPDVVALQEVDRKTKRADFVDQPAEFAKLTGMHVEFGKALDIHEGEYGNAILTKAKPIEAKNHVLPNPSGNEVRAALVVKAKPSERLPEMLFVSTHHCYKFDANRLAQVKEINRLIPEKDGPPVVLGGDFNATQTKEPIKELEKQWSQTWPTHPSIDFVFVRKADPWKVVETKLLNEDKLASDHFPVFVVLEWQGPLARP